MAAYTTQEDQLASLLTRLVICNKVLQVNDNRLVHSPLSTDRDKALWVKICQHWLIQYHNWAPKTFTYLGKNGHFHLVGILRLRIQISCMIHSDYIPIKYKNLIASQWKEAMWLSPRSKLVKHINALTSQQKSNIVKCHWECIEFFEVTQALKVATPMCRYLCSSKTLTQNSGAFCEITQLLQGVELGSYAGFANTDVLSLPSQLFDAYVYISPAFYASHSFLHSQI